MRFFDYHDDTPRLLKRFSTKANPLTRDDLYRLTMNTPNIGTFALRHAMWEHAWIKAGRPYYDLYPGMIDPFERINLDIKPTSVRPPGGHQNLLVRFPDHPDNKTARTMFIAWQPTKWSDDKPVAEPYLVVGGDFGERDELGLLVSSVYAPPPDDTKTMQEWLNCLPYEDQMPYVTKTSTQYPSDQAALAKLVRIAVCLCLIGSDPDIVTPQVLNRDADKARNATPEELAALADRARQNGKYGFSIGAKLETAPHIRRPHLAVYHTGAGRQVPVIKMRKGSVVKRQRVAEVPTGFLGGGDSGTEA